MTDKNLVFTTVSIHAFRGEGDGNRVGQGSGLPIVSIHAFRGEGDVLSSLPLYRRSMFQSTPSGGKATYTTVENLQIRKFQSTPSGGKATNRVGQGSGLPIVSIHAFRGEGDVISAYHICAPFSFNPRLPGGRRLLFCCISANVSLFQSTPSGGKATGHDHQFTAGQFGVSIHAFRGEGDSRLRRFLREITSFNPRLPGGRRLYDVLIVSVTL